MLPASVTLHQRARYFCYQRQKVSDGGWRSRLHQSLFTDLLEKIETFSEEECAHQPVLETATYLRITADEIWAPWLTNVQIWCHRYNALFTKTTSESPPVVGSRQTPVDQPEQELRPRSQRSLLTSQNLQQYLLAQRQDFETLLTHFEQPEFAGQLPYRRWLSPTEVTQLSSDVMSRWFDDRPDLMAGRIRWMETYEFDLKSDVIDELAANLEAEGCDRLIVLALHKYGQEMATTWLKQELDCNGRFWLPRSMDWLLYEAGTHFKTDGSVPMPNSIEHW